MVQRKTIIYLKKSSYIGDSIGRNFLNNFNETSVIHAINTLIFQNVSRKQRVALAKSCQLNRQPGCPNPPIFFRLTPISSSPLLIISQTLCSLAYESIKNIASSSPEITFICSSIKKYFVGTLLSASGRYQFRSLLVNVVACLYANIN